MSNTDQYRSSPMTASCGRASRPLTLIATNFSNSQKSDARCGEHRSGYRIADQGSCQSIRNGGEEIDRLGDPLATDEERQLRKRRLISGPQDFAILQQSRED